MLPQRERLTKSGLFQRAYTARKSISSPFATLYVVLRNKQPGTRGSFSAVKPSEKPSEEPLSHKSTAKMPLVGFVVAKKVCKSSVVRNRVKRRLREAYRLLRQSQIANELSLDQWYALVWVLHDKSLSASWEDMQRTVVETLKSANKRFGKPSGGAKSADLSKNVNPPNKGQS